MSEEKTSTPEVIEITAATPETVATPTPETEAAQGDKTQADKSFSQAELNEIVQKEKAKAEARAERRALKVYADKLEAMHQKPPNQQQQPQRDDGQPKMEHYQTVDAYLDARDQWRDSKREQEKQQQQQQQQHQSRAAKTAAVFAEAEELPEFNREEFDSLPISGVVADAILESDVAAKLMAHLANNPDEAKRIYNLSPVRQAAEIGKLEDKLASAPKTSNAPNPIKPLGSGRVSENGLSDNLSTDEWLRRRNKELKAR